MRFRSIQRRVGKLEGSGLFTSPIDYPPLTSAEVEDVAGRAQTGTRFSREELDRLQHHSPIIDGEFLISANRGQVFVKRYPGVDVSEI